MTEDPVATRCTQIIAEHLVRHCARTDPSAAPDSRLQRDLQLDSFDMIAITLDLEEAFGIVIDADSETGLHAHDATVADVIDVVRAQLAPDPAEADGP